MRAKGLSGRSVCGAVIMGLGLAAGGSAGGPPNGMLIGGAGWGDGAAGCGEKKEVPAEVGATGCCSESDAGGMAGPAPKGWNGGIADGGG